MAITAGSRGGRPSSKLPEISQPWSRRLERDVDDLLSRVRRLEEGQQVNSKNIEALLGAVQEINQRLTAIEENL